VIYIFTVLSWLQAAKADFRNGGFARCDDEMTTSKNHIYVICMNINNILFISATKMPGVSEWGK